MGGFEREELAAMNEYTDYCTKAVALGNQVAGVPCMLTIMNPKSVDSGKDTPEKVEWFNWKPLLLLKSKLDTCSGKRVIPIYIPT